MDARLGLYAASVFARVDGQAVHAPASLVAYGRAEACNLAAAAFVSVHPDCLEVRVACDLVTEDEHAVHAVAPYLATRFRRGPA